MRASRIIRYPIDIIFGAGSPQDPVNSVVGTGALLALVRGDPHSTHAPSGKFG